MVLTLRILLFLIDFIHPNLTGRSSFFSIFSPFIASHHIEKKIDPKFLNDKFAYEEKKLSPRLAAAEKWEETYAGFTKDEREDLFDAKAADPNTAGMARANAACAGENILLAATKLGLGSCYLESPTLAFNIPEVAAAAKIPEGAQPQAVIVFGYTDDTAPHAAYPEELENIVYVE